MQYEYFYGAQAEQFSFYRIQREHISPMEKARAYAMRLEAVKHQGRRTDLTSDQVGPKLTAAEKVAAGVQDTQTQVKRYIRLNSLVPDLQKKVDSGNLKFNPAVELSYLTPDEQQSFLDYAEAQDCTCTVTSVPAAASAIPLASTEIESSQQRRNPDTGQVGRNHVGAETERCAA